MGSLFHCLSTLQTGKVKRSKRSSDTLDLVIAVGCGTVAAAVGVAGVIVMTRRLVDKKRSPEAWGKLDWGIEQFWFHSTKTDHLCRISINAEDSNSLEFCSCALIHLHTLFKYARARLFERRLTANLQLTWFNPRLNSNRRLILLFKARLARTSS